MDNLIENALIKLEHSDQVYTEYRSIHGGFRINAVIRRSGGEISHVAYKTKRGSFKK